MTNQRSGREPGTWEFWKIDGPHGYNTLRYVYARWNWPHGLAYFFNVFVAIIVYLLFLGLSLALFWHRIAPIVGYMFVSRAFVSDAWTPYLTQTNLVLKCVLGEKYPLLIVVLS